jgi:hypothetical protein
MSGIPWSVVTAGGGTVTVNLRCECGHDWSATRVTDQSAPYEGRRDAVIERRQKADRRSAI